MSTPLVKKLGIKPETQIWLIDAPTQFAHLLDPLPQGSTLIALDPQQLPNQVFEMAILFASSEVVFRHHFQSVFRHLGSDSTLWLAWPKKAAKTVSDMSFQVVQHLGLTHGLVDNKVCSIDATWTALRMVVRLENRSVWIDGEGVPH